MTGVSAFSSYATQMQCNHVAKTRERCIRQLFGPKFYTIELERLGVIKSAHMRAQKRKAQRGAPEALRLDYAMRLQ